MLRNLYFEGVNFMKYEINDETLAIMPFDKDKARVLEEADEYIVDEIPYSIMEDSCKYFGSSFEGRILGSKNILGSVYKAPIFVEESQNLIFFPTEALSSETVSWISYKKIKSVEKCGKRSKIIFNNGESIIVDCPYFSIKNQIFRCNMLDSISSNRKIVKKND